ncbi:MAG TPA: methyltransferase domain-containing protein [Candidatus Saccharimonadales bacterium]|nr:methyltransferase domain-containing protein [Candidatus Saccharimonadales bacterium]
MQDRGMHMLKMASKLCDWKSMVDIGCGNQQLKEVAEAINPGVKYTGIDRLKHRPSTLIADFNKGEYPKVKADLAVVSGVFEYIRSENVDSFIDNVCKTAPFVAFSYWPVDYLSNTVAISAKTTKTRPKVWVNHFTLAEIVELFNQRGFQLEILKRYKTSSQYMMVFTNTRP